jgi:hypothetical protein
MCIYNSLEKTPDDTQTKKEGLESFFFYSKIYKTKHSIPLNFSEVEGQLINNTTSPVENIKRAFTSPQNLIPSHHQSSFTTT